jgi:hypothetical protein
MGNRSRYAAVTAAATVAGLVSARRRASLGRAMVGLRETILPTHVDDLPTTRMSEGDEAHAPGHRHLGRGADAQVADTRRRGRVPYAGGRGRRSPDR